MLLEKLKGKPYIFLVIGTILPLITIGIVIWVLASAHSANSRSGPLTPTINEEIVPGDTNTGVQAYPDGSELHGPEDGNASGTADVSGDGSEGTGDVNEDISVISEGDIEVDTAADDPATDTGEGDADVSVIPSAPADPIEAYISGMTLHEKVCQMIIATPASLTGERKPKTAGLLLHNALTAYPVGGLIFDTGNISSGDQIRKYLSDAQSLSKTPLILTLDEEGGRVTRLQTTVGTTQIGPMYDYHDLGTGTAYSNAAVIASDIKSYGFNMDLAPVADVWSNPENTVIGDRAYSTDYAQASELVASAVQGFHSQNIPCCLKHFPGHGNSSEDSHYGAVYIYKSLADIKAEECLPFASGINAGADCVMMGHLIVSELGDDPALFSGTLIQGVLRGELGFKGIVMTDSLQMKAMTDYYGVSDIAVRSVSAGCDILLMPSDVPFTVKAIEDAVLAGTIPESRIDESVRRIISLKVKYGIIQL